MKRYIYAVIFLLSLFPIVTNANERVKIETIDSVNNIIKATINNNVKLFYKHSDLDTNKVRISAIIQDGLLNNDISDSTELKFVKYLLPRIKIGNINYSEYINNLKSHKINAHLYVDDITSGIEIQCEATNIDYAIKQLLQIENNIKADSITKIAVKELLKIAILSQTPKNILYNSINKEMYNNHPIYSPITTNDIESVNLGKVADIINQKFNNLQQFSFIVVGNVELDSVINEIFDAFLSRKNGMKKGIPVRIPIQLFSTSKDIELNSTIKDERNYVYKVYSGSIPFSYKNDLYFDIFDEIIDLQVTDSLKNSFNKPLKISSNSTLTRYNNTWNYSYYFISGENYKHETDKLDAIIYNTVAQQFDIKYFMQAVQNASKTMDSIKYNNEFWVSCLKETALYGDNSLIYIDELRDITINKFYRFLKNIYLDKYISIFLTSD